jgi:4a-hydroxytetrahydrobiopterin dehydratase
LTPPKQISNRPAAIEPKFSPRADERKLMGETKALIEAKWTLDKEQMGIEKTYYFKTYTKALVRDSSNIIAALSDGCRILFKS